jgi:putative ABC transport system ATP-binding protein
MIELRGVAKTYGRGANAVNALTGLNLTVGRGEFVSIMGPSGSGKSTLLNLLSAIDTPDAGQIIVDGCDIAKLDDDALTLFRRHKIGLIFQFFNLLPTLNALDNTLLPVMLDRSIEQADERRAIALLEQVGLGARRLHRLHELSGGEMQRVAIARALMLKPQLVLADEPTGNLDSVTGAAILGLLSKTCEGTGTTVVMVTHDRSAAQVGNRILWLRDGQIVHDEQTQRTAQLGAAQ